MKSRFMAAAAAGLMLPLLGCGNTEQIQICPSSGIVAEAANLTVLRPGAPADPSGELYTVQMTGAKTDCELDKDTNETDSTLDLTFHASRAPSAQGAHYAVQYFAAGTSGARVITKNLYTVSFDFAPGAQTADFTAHVDSVRIHMEPGMYAGNYQVTAGLQITDADRAYNRKMGRYAP